MSETTVHVFERAGLGLAPFRYIGYERKTYQAAPGAPIQPGASCDYCGTGIIDTCRIQSADGRTFKVGSTCVNRTGDRGLVDPVKRAIRREKAEQRKTKEIFRIEAALALLDSRPDLQDRFRGLPHPTLKPVDGRPALTLLNWANWQATRAGHAGRLALARRIEREAKK